MKYGMLLLLFIPAGTWGASKSADILFQEGNRAFAEGQYRQALESYRQAERAGSGISPELYYNLGQTYWKLGEKGSSLFSFKKALTMRPFWKQASENLAQLRQDLKLPTEISRWGSWLKKIPLNTWTFLWLAVGWTTAFLAVRILFSRVLRWLLVGLLLITTLLAILLGIIVWFCRHDLQTAVVLKNAVLRFSPSAQSPQRRILNEGSMCRILDEKNDFAFVETLLENQKSDGWLELKNLGRLYEK